eukprot:3130068-Rhodomonas_salina.1
MRVRAAQPASEREPHPSLSLSLAAGEGGTDASDEAESVQVTHVTCASLPGVTAAHARARRRGGPLSDPS